MFQSTPLREGRQRQRDYPEQLQFQSTPLREGRLRVPPERVKKARGFNPRPCVRGDMVSLARESFGTGFNPRPCVRGDADAIQEPC